MRVVVAGATGLIGSLAVARLRDHGVEVVPVSRATGVDISTGDGLDVALRAADVIVDVTESPSRNQEVSTAFFATATSTLLKAAATAGVEHYVALSMVGTDRVGSGYFQAKAVQEDLAKRSTVPHSVVRAPLFFESVETVAVTSTRPDGVYVPPLLMRPAAADDVASAVAHVAVGVPLFGVLEVAGPEVLPFEELASQVLAARGRASRVVADQRALYFGAMLEERTLLPAPGADLHLGHHTFDRWLKEL
ncbi:SDR family oxidoreductase [Streptomyces fructofermentans]|uniref:NAD-dependent epimerase/dehydratase domain-containing protein n=1 Tax=Streptomyces fructofermentans TaxID=152141 RepID=A0A918NIN7_9ACTN|nr:NAD-dependent epimerase/dehydratase family protein [Streptomyces fructofermentans]GGX76116.1 hypothetical protein GCM10010515_49670 [Streptomyces fructofermentans]